jgi:hypothetical protein
MENEANYNSILDFILKETIKRKNTHPYIGSKTNGYLSDKIVSNKDIIEKFEIENYECESLYYELTSNWYINPQTGNVTLKGIEFINNGGFTKEQKRKSIASIARVSEIIVLAGSALVGASYAAFEIWRYYYGYVRPY